MLATWITMARSSSGLGRVVLNDQITGSNPVRATKLMSFSITTNPPNEEDITSLIGEMKKSPHVGLLTSSLWRKFYRVYVAKNGRKLIGACAIVKLSNWIKLGPVIILSKYQGKGYGKKLLTRVINDFHKQNLYIGSSNPAVSKIVKDLRFIRVMNFLQLPLEVKLYLIKYFFMRINQNFILDDIRKKSLFKKGNYLYYIRANKN